MSPKNDQPKAKPKRRRRIIALGMLAFHVMGLFSAVDAVMTARTSQGAIGWSVSLITFPYVAVPAYWVLGRSEFAGYTEAWQENEEAIDELFRRIAPQIEATFIPIEERIPEYEALKRLSNLGITASNQTTLLVNGEATYESMLDGIAAATDYILLEFYIVRADGIGNRIKDALIERAQNGVRIYFVYDELGSGDLPDTYGEELRAAGIEFTPFNTTQGSRNRFQLNFRNHRKILVVDGKSAWVGGLNIGDDYVGEDPALTPWRDTHMRIDGPAALQAQVVFLSDWYWATRQLIDLNWTVQESAKGESGVMIIPGSPAQKRETATLFFTLAINSARDRLWITTPYFVPDEGIINALELAAFRGVDVRIIIPGLSDNALALAAAFHYVEELGESGIKFYQYADGFMHQKVMLIDDQTATVGTANFDNRSFRLNFEIVALVRDPDFAANVEAMLLNDMQNSTELDPAAQKALSYWQRIPRRVARLFAPVL